MSCGSVCILFLSLALSFTLATTNGATKLSSHAEKVLNKIRPKEPNGHGERILKKIINSKLLKLKTCGRPRITNVMRNATLLPGQSITFRCSVDMKCLVSYIQWYHEMTNGTLRLLKTATDYGDPYSFKVHQVEGLDEGFYTCVAGNIMGETLSSAYLEINSAQRENAKIIVLFVIASQLLRTG